MLHSSSWAKVSALGILAAAGTVLGTSAIAAGQSAPVRIERRVEVAPGGGPQVRVHVEDEGEHTTQQRRAVVKRQGGGQEQRVIVRALGDGDGEGCSCQGCPCCGDNKGEASRFGAKGETRRRVSVLGEPTGAGHGLGFGDAGGKAVVVGPDGQRREFNFGGKGSGDGKAKLFRMAPGAKGGHSVTEFRSHGQAVIVGPDGHKREFNFGDGHGEGGPHLFRLDGQGEGGEHKIELRRLHKGHGGSGAGNVRGHIVIIGPDGQEQVFDFGGEHGLNVRRLAVPVQPLKLRDGGGSGTHLWRMKEDDGPARERKVIRLRGQGGGVL